MDALPNFSNLSSNSNSKSSTWTPGNLNLVHNTLWVHTVLPTAMELLKHLLGVWTCIVICLELVDELCSINSLWVTCNEQIITPMES